MAIALVQSNEGTSTLANPTGLALASPAASGSIIVLGMASDDYTSGSTLDGWTESSAQLAIRATLFHGAVLWWRLGDGSTNSFQYHIGSATNSSWIMAEFSGVNTAAPFDVAATSKSANAGVSSATTNAVAPTTGNRVGVCVMSGSAPAGNNQSTDTTSWLNSFTHIRSSGPASFSGTGDITGMAYRLVTGDGSTTFSSGCSYPNSEQSTSGLLAFFKEAGAAAGKAPPFTRNTVDWQNYLVR